MVICKIYKNSTLTFSSENIILNSFSLNRFSSSAVAPEFGNVSAGELLFTIDTSTTQNTVERGDLLTVEFDDTYSIGEFIVTSVAKRQGAFDVTCLDRMIELDGKADLSGVTFPLTASAFINQIYGTGLGMTVDISANVHNPTIDDPLFEDGITYRQVLSKVCECMGANAWYTDKLNIGWYEDSDVSYTSAEYFSADLTEKGFDVAVEVTDDVTATPVEIKDNGITLRIVANPFLANKTSEGRTAIATAIKQNIGTVSWYGGNAVVIPELPYLLPNTIVEIDGKAFPVTSVTHGINENIKLESKIQSDDNAYNYDFTRDIAKVKEEVDNLEIGGKNLLLDTNAPSLTKVYASANRYFSNSSIAYSTPEYIEVSDAPIDVDYGARFTITANGESGRDLSFYRSTPVKMINGEDYTMSAYFKVTNGTKAEIRLYYGVSVYPMKNVTIKNTEWKRYSWTFKYNDSDSGGNGGARVYFGVSGKYLATVEACGFQLEKGTKATDYAPSPEEMEVAKKHFFYRDDSGIHITMTENDYNTGRNIAMDSNGLDVRNGTTSLAYFGATSRVGQISQNNVQITDSGISFKKGNKELGSIYLDTQYNIGELDLYSIKCRTLKADESVNVGTCRMTGSVSSGTPILGVEGDVSAVKGGVPHVLSNKVDKFTNTGAWNGSASLPDISVASSTSVTTEIGSITLPNGIYLIIIYVQWSANANGRRYINLARTTGATSGDYVWLADSVSSTPAGVCTQRLVCTLDNTADTKWYLNALQNSGSNLTAKIRYNCIKLI